MRGLLDLVARFSDFGSAPWALSGKFEGKDLEESDPAEALVKAASSEWQPAQRETLLAGAWCRRHGYDRKSDESVGVSLQELRRLELRIDLEINDKDQEQLFVAIARQLGLPDARYCPHIAGAGGYTESVLWMALERDYFMRSDCDDVARSIAPLLPRLTWQYMAGKDGVPARLGWLNYWSPRVAQAIEFPDPVKDARILPLCAQLDNGSWFVKLTGDPLDLVRPDHVEAVAWAYWRFDKIGKRKLRVNKSAKPKLARAETGAADASGLRLFVLRERDEHRQWWDLGARPIRAASAEDALRIYFARNAYGRAPKPKETLAKLRDAYDGIAAEVGLTRGEDIEAVEATHDST